METSKRKSPMSAKRRVAEKFHALAVADLEASGIRGRDEDDAVADEIGIPVADYRRIRFKLQTRDQVWPLVTAWWQAPSRTLGFESAEGACEALAALGRAPLRGADPWPGIVARHARGLLTAAERVQAADALRHLWSWSTEPGAWPVARNTSGFAISAVKVREQVTALGHDHPLEMLRIWRNEGWTQCREGKLTKNVQLTPGGEQVSSVVFLRTPDVAQILAGDIGPGRPAKLPPISDVQVQSETALRAIFEMYADDPSRFFGHDPSAVRPSGGWVGRIDPTFLAVRPECVRAIVEGLGVPLLPVFRVFRSLGWARCLHKANTGVARIDGIATCVFLFLLTPDVRAMVGDLLDSGASPGWDIGDLSTLARGASKTSWAIAPVPR